MSTVIQDSAQDMPQINLINGIQGSRYRWYIQHNHVMRINTYFFITFNLKVSNDITNAEKYLEDTRPQQEFRVKTISGYKVTDVQSAFKKSLTEGR